jgi:hypothetical protein
VTYTDLFEYAATVQEDRPGAVGHNNPATSVAAALSVRTGTQRWRTLTALAAAGDQGLTAFEAAERLGHPRPHVIGTRIIELRELDLVAKNGETRPTDTGHQAEVYIITPLGRSVLEAGEGE